MAPRQIRTASPAAALLLACGLAVTACGSPDRVTIIDPNVDGSTAAGAESRPVAKYGKDAVLRATALARARGDLAAARRLGREGREDLALQHLALAQESLVPAAGRLKYDHPQRWRQVEALLERLQQGPGSSHRVRALDAAEAQLLQSVSLVVPAGASTDSDFQAAVLSSVLLQAVQTYEQALVGGQAVELAPLWRTSWGMLDVARRSIPEEVPAGASRPLEQGLERTFRKGFPSLARPPAEPLPASDVERLLLPATDLLLGRLRIDVTSPPPSIHAAAALDQLTVELRAVERLASGSAADPARARLRSAVRLYLVPGSGALALVDPGALTRLEQGMIEQLPRLLGSGSPHPVAAATARDLAQLAEQSAAAVRHEVELLAGAE